MPPAGLKPAISANKRPQTHTSDRAATGIGTVVNLPTALLVFILNTLITLPIFGPSKYVTKHFQAFLLILLDTAAV